MITHQNSLESFYKQVIYARENYQNHGLRIDSFQNILVGGLGGSGISGRIAKSYFQSTLGVPFEVVNDYSLPGYVNEKTLVILGSYSGNTEETLTMYDEALQRSCTILVITSGGEIKEKAIANGHTTFFVETGFQPRMALGYSLCYLLKILAELSGQDINGDLDEVIESLQDNTRHKSISASLQKKFQGVLNRRYVIICDAAFEGVAIRFAQQLNENSKQEAFVNLLPESNHNVIESYYGLLPANFIFLNSNSNERVSARFDFVRSLLERENNKVSMLETNDAELVTLFDLIHALDWFTIDITALVQVDPMQIANIISLKEYLTEV